MRSGRRCPTMPTVVSCSYVWLMTLHLLLSPCQAIVIRLPLARAVGMEPAEDSEPDSSGRTRRIVTAVTQRMEGISGEGYFVNLSVGTPPQRMQILVDTGSSNFAIAAGPDPHISQYFNRSASSTFNDEHTSINVPYTQGEWDGTLGKDVVTLTSLPDLQIHPYIAFIDSSTGFFIPESNWQGIVGLAYQSIARPNTLTPFWDSMREEANLSDVFSMQLCGSAHSHNASANPAMEGNLVFGGVSEDLYTGDMFYSPIIREMYYEVVLTDIAVGGHSLNMECKEYNYDKTIVDSGTTHLRLPTRVYKEVVQRIQSLVKKVIAPESMPSALFWTGEQLLCWDDLSVAVRLFPTVSLSLLSTKGHHQFFTLHLTAQHYLRSVENVNTGFFGPIRTCLKFGIYPSESGAVLGALFMESFFVVFDRQNKCMGFAHSTCPPPYPDSPDYHIIDGHHSSKDNLTACQYLRAIEDDSTLQVVTYIMAAICLVCSVPLIIVLLQWQLRRCTAKPRMPQDLEAETVLTDNR